jgi:two-component system, sensor histidine kinase and response regulator
MVAAGQAQQLPFKRFANGDNSMNDYSILVVDDEPDNFEVIEALLASMNYTLHYASHGQEAIASLDKFEPDLILLDVMMPGIDGIEVCKRIKAMSEWQAVPIVMVTALSGATDLARCLASGADDFISKPVNGVELRARVHSMLRIKKQHDRIEALSKLQRNSINSLKSNLSELNSDLSIGFSNEATSPLHNILGKVHLLQQNLDKMTASEIKEKLDAVNQSALEINLVNQKFSFSRQLSPSVKASDRQSSCSSKISIEQIATRQIDQLKSPTKLFFDIEDAELAVDPKHLQYILNELLDYVLNSPEANDIINIYGYVKKEEFHLYLDNREIDPNYIYDTQALESTQFKPASNSEQKLNNGLKIAKKIVEVYDGLFLIADTDKIKPTIYINLPLTRLAVSPKPLVSAAVNYIGSISDELQESIYLG